MRFVLVCGLSLALAGCSAEDDTSGASSGSKPGGESGDGFGNSTLNPADPGFGNSTLGTAGSGAVPSDPSARLGGETCADAMVNATRVRPTVVFVVDGSGSMEDDFGGQTRWDALRSALMDAGGVIPTLQNVVDFGMTIYDGPAEQVAGQILSAIFPPLPGTPPPPMGACAREVSITAAPENYLNIDSQYPNAPLGGTTPTQTALRSVVEAMPDQATVQADPNLGEQVIILATDGAPNEFCGGNLDAQAEVISITQQAVAKGIKLFVISLAGQDGGLQAHLEQVAQVANTGHPPFTPMSKDQLVDTLRMILGEAISCDIVLNGSVQPGAECMGFVSFNNMDLICNDPNGWMLKDANTITITGASCDALRDSPNALVTAGFPCGVFTPD